ncbi:hypothetical protein AB0F46_42410 [Streptomyces sp. NPDC026665]|uniref:hypothetical protein n=1 Tax=Streptomyces sp. NPDC026665 TaxID=3154798 RepID=UPI0034017A90
MLRTHTRPQPSDDAARFDVFIPPGGPVLVNGKPLQATDGKTVYEAVLDMLHLHAASGQGEVEATVNNHAANTVVRLTVAPDGSSRIVAEQDVQQTPLSRSAPADADSGGGTVRHPAPMAPAVHPRQRDQAEDFLLSPPRVDREPARVEPLPEGLWREIEEIRSVAAAGDLQEALGLASSLRERLSVTAGVDNEYSLEARGLEAYVAHLKGDFRHAVTLVLGVARVRCNQRDQRASGEAFRAAAVWQQLTDHGAVLAHGHELLNMCRRLMSWAPEAARLAQLAQHIEQRIQALDDHVRADFSGRTATSHRGVHALPWA